MLSACYVLYGQKVNNELLYKKTQGFRVMNWNTVQMVEVDSCINVVQVVSYKISTKHLFFLSI
jgi:hypothetical protein